MSHSCSALFQGSCDILVSSVVPQLPESSDPNRISDVKKWFSLLCRNPQLSLLFLLKNGCFLLPVLMLIISQRSKLKGQPE